MAEPRDRAGQPCRLENLPAASLELIDAARDARQHAHAPYSGYLVGAAVRLPAGNIVSGCNVEISSYGLTMCAERVALFAARAAGGGRPQAIAVVGPGDGSRPTPPCGACRQVLWDLAGDVPVLLATLDGLVEEWTAASLLPSPFGPEHLETPSNRYNED